MSRSMMRLKNRQAAQLMGDIATMKQGTLRERRKEFIEACEAEGSTAHVEEFLSWFGGSLESDEPEEMIDDDGAGAGDQDERPGGNPRPSRMQ